MANRRMFSIRLINSAKFLKMPISSQALYFHLGLNADDDGIVEAYNVLNFVGCSEDDLRVLVTKGFVKVLNEDLVAYITDWTENNKIRPDRKIDSIYKDLLLSICPDVNLIEKKQRADAKQKGDNGQPMDVQRTTNGQPMDGIGKVRLGKVRLGKDRLGEDTNTAKTDGETIKKVVDLYNETCISLPKVQKISEPRKRTIKTRLKTYSVEDFETLFKKAEASNFLTGGGNKGWKANFDWLLEEKHMVKVLEDSYIDREKKSKAAQEQEEAFRMMAEWAEEDD